MVLGSGSGAGLGLGLVVRRLGRGSSPGLVEDVEADRRAVLGDHDVVLELPEPVGDAADRGRGDNEQAEHHEEEQQVPR